MSHYVSGVTALALTFGAANAALAQVSPQLEWKELRVPAFRAAPAPQLAPFRAAPQPIPPLLVARLGTLFIGPTVDPRPSCTMPVGAAPAGTGDSMPVARTDVTKIEHMPVIPSLCSNAP